MFGEPVAPDVPGLDGSRGRRSTPRDWADDHDLTGERVAVIGSAASAVQLIPEIAPLVGSLTVYQRSANWVLARRRTTRTPRRSSRRSPRDLDAVRAVARRDLHHHRPQPHVRRRRTPGAGRAVRRAEHRPRSRIREVRDRLTPDRPFGCKRPLASNLYYPTFNLPARRARHRRRSPRSPSTASSAPTGATREVDTIILATGFTTTKFLAALDVAGRDGVDIDDAWADGRRPTSASPPPGSRTCSCSTARTPTTGRSST